VAVGIVRFLNNAQGPVIGDVQAGCPIAPTELESPIIRPRLRVAAARCFALRRPSSWHDSALTDGPKTQALKRPRRLSRVTSATAFNHPSVGVEEFEFARCADVADNEGPLADAP
jgi:hypothetical protein